MNKEVWRGGCDDGAGGLSLTEGKKVRYLIWAIRRTRDLGQPGEDMFCRTESILLVSGNSLTHTTSQNKGRKQEKLTSVEIKNWKMMWGSQRSAENCLAREDVTGACSNTLSSPLQLVRVHVCRMPQTASFFTSALPPLFLTGTTGACLYLCPPSIPHGSKRKHGEGTFDMPFLWSLKIQSLTKDLQGQYATWQHFTLTLVLSSSRDDLLCAPWLARAHAHRTEHVRLPGILCLEMFTGFPVLFHPASIQLQGPRERSSRCPLETEAPVSAWLSTLL